MAHVSFFFLYSNEPLKETVTWNNNAPWWMASSAVGQEKQIDYISQNILSFHDPTALFALLQGVFVPFCTKGPYGHIFKIVSYMYIDGALGNLDLDFEKRF